MNLRKKVLKEFETLDYVNTVTGLAKRFDQR